MIFLGLVRMRALKLTKVNVFAYFPNQRSEWVDNAAVYSCCKKNSNQKVN